MKDLIERLRATEIRHDETGPEYSASINPDGPEAADLIQSQQSRIKELEGALAGVMPILDGLPMSGIDASARTKAARTTLGDKA